MACENCGTVIIYGKKKNTKRRLCLDCWKDAASKKDDAPDEKENKK